MESRSLLRGEEEKLKATMYKVFPGWIKDCDYFTNYVMTEESYSPSNVKVAVDKDGGDNKSCSNPAERNVCSGRNH